MMRQWINRICIIVVAAGSLFQSANASGEYIAKVISQLDSYVVWDPSKKFEGNGEMIVISAIGQTDLMTELRKLTKENSATGKSIKVRVVQPDMIPSNSHILVLDIEDEAMIKSITEKLRGTGTLIISHGKGYGLLGSALNFVEEDPSGSAKPVLELNIGAAKAEGLSVKPSLLKIVRVLEAP